MDHAERAPIEQRSASGSREPVAWSLNGALFADPAPQAQDRRALVNAMRAGPAVVAQRERIRGLFGAAAQLTPISRIDQPRSRRDPADQASNAGDVVQRVKICGKIPKGGQPNIAELLHGTFVPPSYVLRYVPDVSDNVYIHRDDLANFPYPHVEPASAPVADTLPLYHVTGREKLGAISNEGLRAGKGGTGGFTDEAATIDSNSNVQSDRQETSRNLVHFGSRSTANTYYIGFKLLSAHAALQKRKEDEALMVLRLQQPQTPLFKLKPAIRQMVEADPEFQASYAKLHAARAVLVKHEQTNNNAAYDADPDEAQSPETGPMAVRTNRGVPPEELNIMTSAGEMPLLDFKAKQTAEHAPTLAGPESGATTEGEALRLAGFYSGVNKAAYDKKQQEKDKEKDNDK